MAHLRSRTGRYAASVARLQQGKLVPTNVEDRCGRPVVTCAAYNACDNPIMDDAPVPLCAKHVRQTYEFAQGVIADQLLIAAARLA